MNQQIINRILAITGGTDLQHVEQIQSLWSGYGELVKCGILGSEHTSVIVKHIKLPDERTHPRGWNTNRSHERKMRSYEVERHWYSDLAGYTDEHCRIPKALDSWQAEGEMLIVMEDLDATFMNQTGVMYATDLKLAEHIVKIYTELSR